MYRVFFPGLLATLVVCTFGGCMAPVKISAYPNMKAEAIPLEVCRQHYDEIQVLGIVPKEDDFEEIGYMTLLQSSDWEYEYTSEDEQIRVARIQACQWGADAIVILESMSDIGGDRFIGDYYWDKHICRIIAIRFVEQSDSTVP